MKRPVQPVAAISVTKEKAKVRKSSVSVPSSPAGVTQLHIHSARVVYKMKPHGLNSFIGLTSRFPFKVLLL